MGPGAKVHHAGRASDKALENLIQETDRFLYITDPLGPESAEVIREQWRLTRRALDRVYREEGIKPR